MKLLLNKPFGWTITVTFVYFTRFLVDCSICHDCVIHVNTVDFELAICMLYLDYFVVNPNLQSRRTAETCSSKCCSI